MNDTHKTDTPKIIPPPPAPPSPPIIQQSRLSLIPSLKDLQSALKKLKPIDKNE